MTPEDFIAQLRTYLGVPFWHCGRNRNGVDCVGLPICALRDLGYPLADVPAQYSVHVDPDVLCGWIERYCVRVDLVDAQAGDLLLFTSRRNPQHVAVLTSPGTMIHAWDAVDAVSEHVVTSAWWKVLYCVYRWKEW